MLSKENTDRRTGRSAPEVWENSVDVTSCKEAWETQFFGGSTTATTAASACKYFCAAAFVCSSVTDS